jgi:nucleotide-binding universal stress UspA family protein
MALASAAGMKPQILVGFDFGSASQRALAWAIDLQRTVGSPLRVVYVINPLPTASAPESPSFSLLSAEELAEWNEKLAQAVRQAGADAATEVILAPSAGPAIVEAAKQHGAELIVLGTNDRGAVSRRVRASSRDLPGADHPRRPGPDQRRPGSSLNESAVNEGCWRRSCSFGVQPWSA